MSAAEEFDGPPPPRRQPRPPAEAPSRTTSTEPKYSTDAGEIYTQAEVERDIMLISREMRQLEAQLPHAAKDAAQAEHKWKVERAKDRTKQRAWGGSGPGGRATEAECDDFALEQHEQEHLDYVLKGAVYEACRDAIRSKQSQLDALRTISANIRSKT